MMGMDAQHNSKDGFPDGLDFSGEIHPDGTAKWGLRMSKEAMVVVTVLVVAVAGKGETLERVLDAVPALLGRLGGRFLPAG